MKKEKETVTRRLSILCRFSFHRDYVSARFWFRRPGGGGGSCGLRVDKFPPSVDNKLLITGLFPYISESRSTWRPENQYVTPPTGDPVQVAARRNPSHFTVCHLSPAICLQAIRSWVWCSSCPPIFNKKEVNEPQAHFIFIFFQYWLIR